MKRFGEYFVLVTLVTMTSFTRANVTRELPGENDDFESIRAKNKVYVDKSDYILKLLESENRYLCLCRPARFGKSNFLQMLTSFFKGRKESFAGLAVYEKYNWQSSYPVVRLNFDTMDVSSVEKFSARLNNEIVQIGHEYGVQIDEKLPIYPAQPEPLEKLPNGDGSKLGRLMCHLTQNWTREQSVVVLIDEYDYPKRWNSPLYQRYFTSDPEQLSVETFLNPFFYELERVKRFVRLLFSTCTTRVLYHYRVKYPDTPITFRDLTYDNQFSKMMGLSGAELKTNMEPHITAMAHSRPNDTFHTLVQKLKQRYNGYCFSRDNTSSESDCRLFNFHSVISCLRDRNSAYLWHPGAHVKYNILNNVTSMTEGNEIFNVFSSRSPVLTISRETLENAFGILPERTGADDTMKSKFSMRALLVLHGYLTFRGYNAQTDEFIVDFPNDEMRESFRRSVLRFVTGKEFTSAEFVNSCKIILKCLLTDTAQNFVNLINEEFLKHNNKNDDIHFYYRFSGNRIAHVLGACDEILQGAMKTKAFYREVVHRDPATTGNDTATNTNNNPFEYIQKFLCDVLVIRLPRQITHTIKIEVERSAACAMNEAMKTINTDDVRQASRNNTFHLMGINFNKEQDIINDWIRMTYTKGKLQNVFASHPRYVRMYNAYIGHLLEYTPIV